MAKPDDDTKPKTMTVGDLTDVVIESIADDLWPESVHGGEGEGCWIEITVNGQRWKLHPELVQ